MGPTLTACNSLPCRCSTIDRQEGSAINHENFHCYLTCSNKQNQQNLSQTERLWWQQCGPNGQTLLVSDTQGPNLIVFGNGWASVASAAKRARVKNNNENFHCYLRGRGLNEASPYKRSLQKVAEQSVLPVNSVVKKDAPIKPGKE